MKRCPECGKLTENKYSCPYCRALFTDSAPEISSSLEDHFSAAEIIDLDEFTVHENTDAAKPQRKKNLTTGETIARILFCYNVFVILYALLSFGADMLINLPVFIYGQ